MPSFYKSLRFPKAEPWSRSAEREIISGVFFCKLFFCANGVKRKVAKDAERVAGYTPKLVTPLFSLSAGGANENKLRYAPYAMHKASLVRKKETPKGVFRCLRAASEFKTGKPV
ncbi:MAG: hypothetical protein IJX62_08230 [Clostridia bacterium]|nr:hypothetical protein [Clostridia bacterium]